MTIDEFRAFCLSFKGTTEDLPFDENTLVFKVKGKMFALADIDLFTGINLKCDPEESVELRERFEGITPGYHMNKRHWITVSTNGSVPDSLIRELTEKSYNLVVAGLSRKVREELEK
jgi:predicted DNA-binding protein (MmcQ/YjbR family)